MSGDYRRFDVTCHPSAKIALGYNTENQFVTRISTWVRRPNL